MTIAQLEEHISSIKLTKNERHQVQRALVIVERALHNKSLSKENLELILTLAKNSKDKIAFIAMEMLILLSEDFDIALDGWRELANSPFANCRFRAVAYLYDQRIPLNFVEEILSRAIYDRSYKVKTSAIERIRTRGVRSLKSLVNENRVTLLPKD